MKLSSAKPKIPSKLLQDEVGDDCSGGGGEPSCTTVTEEKCETRYLVEYDVMVL